MSVNHLSPESSPSWAGRTKALVGLLGLALLGILLVRFKTIVTMVLLSLILTFLIIPFIRWLHVRARLSWTVATSISFLFLIMLILIASTAAGLVAVQQLQSLFQSTQTFFFDLSKQLENASSQIIQLGPWTIDLSQFNLSNPFEQALTNIELLLGRASTIITNLATTTVEIIVRLVFIIVVAYFLSMDNRRIRQTWNQLSIPGYENDILRLRNALAQLWDAFLRGQLVVVSITGLLTWLLMSILGVRFSLGLGIIGGIAKFVPMVGPTTAGAVAAIIALLQPSNWLNLMPLAHALLVVLCVILLDQSIDYVIIPKIMGTSLNLHPVVIIIGALLGATFAGILGLLLSAPAMATLILFSKYIYRKMIDRSPWEPPPIDELPEIRERTLGKFLRRRIESTKTNEDEKVIKE